MELAAYLSERNLTDAAFADAVSMSQSQISRIRRGISRPSWEAVAAIERATGGLVTASDFIKPVTAENFDAMAENIGLPITDDSDPAPATEGAA